MRRRARAPAPRRPRLRPTGVTTPGGRNDAFAAGGIVQIAGDRLTSGSSLAAAATPLPVRLAGTHVEVNGEPAALFSVTPGMVLAQLPVDLPAGADALLTISSVNRASAPIALHVETAAPGIVAVDRAGGVLILYATGLGPTDPTVAAGIPSPARPLVLTRIPPTVRIGNQTAVVQFSGLAPGLVGLYQVNAEIPADVARDADGTVSVILESGGRQSDVYRFAL